MRKLVADHLVSLDGYAGGLHGEIDWFRFDEDSQEWSRNLLRAAGAVIMGRRTYELMLQYWPTPQAMKNEPVIAERLTSLPKLVFSQTLESSSWKNSQFLRRSPVEVIRELKQESGGPLLILGSPNLFAQLWNGNLVDELNLRIQPIVLGQGLPLFPASEFRQQLEPQDRRLFASGVTALKYEVAR